jgi:hypothetical protein
MGDGIFFLKRSYSKKLQSFHCSRIQGTNNKTQYLKIFTLVYRAFGFQKLPLNWGCG